MAKGMTSEMLVMNKTAVAMAADSAITITRKDISSVYNTANKLFSLSPRCSVGIMVYGTAEINQVPWETIIKIYKNKFFIEKRSTLKEYADDFISFLNDSNNQMRKSLFPEFPQEMAFLHLVFRAFSQITSSVDFLEASLKTEDNKANLDKDEKDKILKIFIKMYFDAYQNYNDLEGITEEFKNEIPIKYADTIKRCKDEIFKNYSISEESDSQLNDIGCKVAYKENFIDPSGIVIAGFGEDDVFPSYVSYNIDAILNDKLKFKQIGHIKIDQWQREAHLTPFAQVNTVNTFVSGIDPVYENIIHGYIKNILIESYPKEIKNLDELKSCQKASVEVKLREIGDNIYKEFRKKCDSYCQEKYSKPMQRALETFSKDELARVAETLVNLESFRKRMSMEDETVGGSCDVAIISKGDGFIWIKRKHYFDSAINPQYEAKYY